MADAAPWSKRKPPTRGQAAQSLMPYPSIEGASPTGRIRVSQIESLGEGRFWKLSRSPMREELLAQSPTCNIHGWMLTCKRLDHAYANFISNPAEKLRTHMRLGCSIANAFSKAVGCPACTGRIVQRGGFRRISKAEYSRPTENGGGESREQCDGINSAARRRVVRRVPELTSRGESTHSEEQLFFLKPEVY